MKKFLALAMAMVTLAGCGSTATNAPANSNTPSSQAATDAPKKEIPTLTLSWGNEMHTGILNLPFVAPELFKDRAIRVNPVAEGQGELIANGEVIAILNRVITKGGSECATLMGQNHLDVAFTSSTAMMTAYDAGTNLQIHNPIQCDGVAIAAVKDAPYNTFDEFVAYAKNHNQPIKAGYHSAVSSPRIVLEYALKDAGLKVTEDPSDVEADILLMDLKGVQNLVPSLTSKQVDLWAGPAPHPQTAAETGVGKILATLNDLPEGKWANFPCCVLSARTEISEKYPAVIEALASVATDSAKYANENKEETAKLISQVIGVEVPVLMQSNIVYTTTPDEKFQGGMALYFECMQNMGKFTGRLEKATFDTVKSEIFNYDAINKVLGK